MKRIIIFLFMMAASVAWSQTFDAHVVQPQYRMAEPQYQDSRVDLRIEGHTLQNRGITAIAIGVILGAVAHIADFDNADHRRALLYGSAGAAAVGVVMYGRGNRKIREAISNE